MTISTATASASYTGNGTTQIFPVPFYFLVDTDVKVSRKVATTGVISVLTLNSDYTLSGAGNQAGGSATLVTAPASGDLLFIERNVDLVQETAYPDNGIFPASSHEKALDRLTMITQQLATADVYTLTRDPLADYFDIDGNRLTNMADAADPNDAVSLQQMEQAIAAAQISPSTPASDIALLSNLASTAAGKGAALLGYLTGTVKSFLDGLATDAGATYIKYKAAFTGAIQRTLGAVAEDQVNSEWFGPDRTGATDASAALQLALNAAAGRTLVIRPGAYKIGAALKVKSHTTIYAYGCTFNRGATIDNMIRNDADGTTGGYGANLNIRMFGGTWDGSYSTYTGSACTLAAFGHCTGITIRDATFRNTTTYHYIEVNACKNVLIDNCDFSGGAEQSSSTMEAVQIDAAIGSGQFPWFGPYDGTVCQHITVRDSRFSSCGSGVGTHSDPASQHLNIKIIGNYFDDPYWASIRGQAWSGAQIIGNTISGGYHGILATPAAAFSITDWLVQGNTISGVGTTGYSGATAGRPVSMGLNGSFSTQQVRILGNVVKNCTGNAQYAIYLNGTQKFTVTGNIVDNHNDHGIYSFGAQYGSITANEVAVSNGGNGIQVSNGTEVAVEANRSPNIGTFNTTKIVYTHNIVGTSQSLTSTTGITTPNLVNGTST